jgi:hypothetical protein
MSTPTITGLPTELLHQIIPHILPEGFESLALTCRTLYELCTPFIEHHNYLCSQFQRFSYRETPRDPALPPITTAFELVKRIAIEPIVARYIRHADFDRDTWPPRVRLPPHVPSVHHGGPVVTLFADSSYLGQAGLDWKDYYALMEEDLKHHPIYSQHTAAFILTLLPNIKSLRLPRLWKPLDKTERLLHDIVRQTKQTNLLSDRPSLAQVARFESFSSLGAGHRFDLDKAVPFLALPQVRSFRGPSTVAIGDTMMVLASKAPFIRYGETLETAHLESCCIDDVAIADFLKHTPRLRTLKYSHLTRGGGCQDWNICKFVTAIEREARNHLEELSISIRELRGSILPGKGSMRCFQRLWKLEFPLEIAMCNIADAAARVTTTNGGTKGHTPDRSQPFICDLVPASVSQLSLLSSGKDHHEKALEIMFRDFAATRDSQLPALKEIHVSCPVSPSADNAYQDECANLVAETKKAGVALHLERWPYLIDIPWDGV